MVTLTQEKQIQTFVGQQKKLYKSGALKLDRSYNFIDKYTVIDELRTLVEDDGRSYTAICARAGINFSTMKKWFNGKTIRPQAPTLNAVARVFGKRVGLVDR
jgi:hypothetical protein